MKVLCLGGAGRICRESAYDMLEYGDIEKLTIADYDPQAGKEVAEWLGNPRVDFKTIDVTEHDAAVEIIRGYDVVMDGTTISLNGFSTACIADAGVHGINLNGSGAEDEYNEVFKKNNKTCVPGFGMTPGITNMMAMHAANQLDTVEIVRVSHGAYRPVAFSASIAETTRYEYDPDLPGRIVYEDGKFVQVRPFARPREIALPEPYGSSTEYIIPDFPNKSLQKDKILIV